MSHSIIFFLFIPQVLMAFVVTNEQDPYCEKEKEKCRTQYPYLVTHDVFTVATETQLRTFCNLTEGFIDCMTNYFQECSDPNVPLKEKLSYPMGPLVNTLCTPGNPFIPRFLEFTACYSKVAIEYDVCVKNYVREVEKQSEALPSVSSTEQRICCYMENFFRCRRSVVQSKCSNGVADTDEEISKILMPENIRSSCPEYSYDSPHCSFMHTATVPSAFPSEQPNECQLSQWCKAVFSYIETHDIFDVITDAQLTNLCKSATDSMACAEEHVEKCGTTPEISKTIKVISVIQGLIDGVCKPGDQFRKQYLIFTNSYPNFAGDMDVCREELLKNTKITVQKEMREDNRRAKLCCDLETDTHCRMTAIENKSGKNVAHIAMEVFRILGYKAIESRCSVFGDNNPECPTSYSSSVNNANRSAVTALPIATSTTSASTTTATSVTSVSTTTVTSATSASATKHDVNIPLPLLCILVFIQTSMF